MCKPTNLRMILYAHGFSYCSEYNVTSYCMYEDHIQLLSLTLKTQWMALAAIRDCGKSNWMRE